MEKDQRKPPPDKTGGDVPPFDPDPELVTYLERGRRDDAPAKFRKALDKLLRRDTR